MKSDGCLTTSTVWHMSSQFINPSRITGTHDSLLKLSSGREDMLLAATFISFVAWPSDLLAKWHHQLMRLGLRRRRSFRKDGEKHDLFLFSWNSHLIGILKGFVTLLAAGDKDAKPLEIHREVVCYYSPIFRAASNSRLKEGETQEYRIEDTSRKLVKLLIHVSYPFFARINSYAERIVVDVLPRDRSRNRWLQAKEHRRSNPRWTLGARRQVLYPVPAKCRNSRDWQVTETVSDNQYTMLGVHLGQDHPRKPVEEAVSGVLCFQHQEYTVLGEAGSFPQRDVVGAGTAYDRDWSAL